MPGEVNLKVFIGKVPSPDVGVYMSSVSVGANWVVPGAVA